MVCSIWSWPQVKRHSIGIGLTLWASRQIIRGQAGEGMGAWARWGGGGGGRVCRGGWKTREMIVWLVILGQIT